MSDRWWARPGAVVSIALHVVAAIALIALSGHRDEPKPVDRAIELVLAPPEPPKPLVPPPLPPKAPPVQLQPPKPAPVRRATPVARRLTVPTTAEKAEVTAPPADATPAKPTTEPAAPRNIGMEGIPTDYVNQVYAKINGSAAGHYPRAAKMRHLEGRIGYRLTLSPEGKLLKLDLQSSGESVLDEAAEEAIRAAAPFPHLPDLGGSSYQLSGAIVYKFGD